MTDQLVPIERLNELSETDFASAVKPLFEAAPVLALALYAARPFTTYAQLIDTAEALTSAMSREDQVRVLAAHPRIGESTNAVSAFSYREQGYTSESRENPAELKRVYDRLARLNDEYERRFGFRFVVFVNKRPKAEIVHVLEARLENDPGAELATGRHEMFLIARDRLCSLS